MISLKKGDSSTLEWTIDTSITGWKIRVEIWDDCKSSLKLATLNSGGSDDQVKITDASGGKFNVYIPKDATKNFADDAHIEIEVETTNTVAGEPEILTLIQADIKFLKQRITWTSPS